MQFKVKSQDTLNHLSLHDCFINHAEWLNDSLAFHLDWIEVLKTHPNNNTGKAKNSRNAALLFDNAVEIFCIYYDYTKAEEAGSKIGKQSYSFPDDAEVINTNIIERCKNVEISYDEVTSENGKKIWTCSCQDDSEFRIAYSTVWVCFNDLGEDSWLEFQSNS